jgi:GT2 family glycosyltransferase
MLDLRVARHVYIREFEGGKPLLLSPEHGLIHHYSYAGSNERILRKITTWSHRDEVVPGWYENVWLAWDDDKLMRHLHPTHPPAYGFAERIRRQARAERHEPRGQRQEASGEGRGERGDGRVSVVIPLYGGEDDIRGCLESLTACADLLRDIVVVDNASPDRAAEVAESFPWPSETAGTPLRVVRMGSNAGFAAACNRGASETRGDILLFLNSDTVVPRVGLERLIEALERSGSIAAAGPYTNYAGHFQRIAPTYTSLDTLGLFAEDFAARSAEDVDTDMLVGFCLAIRRNVWDEVGGFDEAFGLGTFEDNDLCYRIRRAGYRLVAAARSFVHHHGSKTLGRLSSARVEPRREGQEEGSDRRETGAFDLGALMRTNEALYRRKWARDLEVGY